jgi:hypothetical protein
MRLPKIRVLRCTRGRIPTIRLLGFVGLLELLGFIGFIELLGSFLLTGGRNAVLED